jgi:hypothetical protein
MICFWCKKDFQYHEIISFLFPQTIREEVLQQEASCDQLLEMSDKMAEESPGPESEAMKQKVQDTTKRWRVLLEVVTKRVEIIEEVVTLSEQFEEEIEIVVTFITITVKTLRDLKPVSYDQEPIEKEQEKLKVNLFFHFICLHLNLFRTQN